MQANSLPKSFSKFDRSSERFLKVLTEFWLPFKSLLGACGLPLGSLIAFFCVPALAGRFIKLAENDIRFVINLLHICPLPAITGNRLYVGNERHQCTEGLKRRGYQRAYLQNNHNGGQSPDDTDVALSFSAPPVLNRSLVSARWL